MKTRWIVALLLCTAIYTVKAQWIKTGPYMTSVLGLLAKDSSVIVSTYASGNIIYQSDSTGSGWIRKDSGLVFQNWITIGKYIIAGGSDSIYSSADNGLSWKGLPGSPRRANCFVISGDTIWTGVNDSYNSAPLYFSPDSGATWKPSGSAVSGGISSIDALVKRGSTFYAGTSSGIFVTNDYGMSWRYWNFSSGIKTVNCMAEIDSMTMLAGTNYGLCFSTDNGNSWNQNTNISSYLNFHDFAQAGNRIFAATEKGFYVSSDKGVNWTLYNEGLPADTCVLNVAIVDTTIYIGVRSSGLFISSINQISWKLANKGIDIPVEVTAIEANGGTVYAGIYNHGIFISNDSGNTWTDFNRGYYPYGAITDFLVDSNKVYASSYLNGVSVDTAGSNWARLYPGPLPKAITAIKKCGNDIYAATSGYGIYKYFNGTWAQTNSSVYSYIATMDVLGQTIYAGSGYGLYASDDGGASWLLTGDPSTNVNTLLIKDSLFYAGMNYDGVFTSADSGKTWQLKTAGLPDPRSARYISFAVQDSNVFVATDHEIFVSADHGNNWNRVKTGFSPDLYIRSLSANLNTIYAATTDGVWMSKAIDLVLDPLTPKDTASPIEVYPNPSDGNFTVFLPNQIIKKAEIFNLLGQSLFQASPNTDRITIFNFAQTTGAGLYFLRVDTDQETLLIGIGVIH